MQQTAQIGRRRRLHAHRRARRSVRLGIVHARIPVHHDQRLGLANRVRDRPGGVFVVRPAGERPRIAGVRPRGRVRRPAQVQTAAQVHPADARGHARRRVHRPVVGHAVRRHRDAGRGLADRDRHLAAGRVVVLIAVERPLRRPAGDVREGGPQMQQTAQIGRRRRLHAHRRARRSVQLGIVHARIPVHHDHRLGLGDVDRHVPALVVVVRAAREHPVGYAAGCVGEAGAQIQRAAQRRAVRIHAGHRPGRAVRGCVVGSAVAHYCNACVRLGDRQIRALVAQSVVGRQIQRPLPDRVAARVLAGLPRQRTHEGIAECQRPRADLVGQPRIGLAVRLGLGVGRDGDGSRADRQVGAHEGQVVVVAQGQHPLLDRIRPHVLAGLPRQRTQEGIAERQRPRADLVGQPRIGLAVRLGLGVGRDHQRAGRDVRRSAGRGVPDVVPRVGPAERDPVDVHQLGQASVPVRESSAGVVDRKVVAQHAVVRQRYGGRGRAVVDLVHSRGGNRQRPGRDVGRRRGGGVDRIVPRVGPRHADPAHRHRFARPHILVGEHGAGVSAAQHITAHAVV